MNAQSLAEFNLDEWKAQLLHVLKHWRDSERLAASPLVNLRSVRHRVESRGMTPVAALREVVEEGIRHLAPEPAAAPSPSDPDDSRWGQVVWRPHNILNILTARFPLLNARDAQLMLGVAESTYYRDYERARAMLAEEIRKLDGIPSTPEATPWQLEFPSGGMNPDDPFYVIRSADLELEQTLLRGHGQTITIRGARQVGKTSLLVRGVRQSSARYGSRVVYVDFQGMGDTVRASLSEVARSLSAKLYRTLGLDLDYWEKTWARDFTPQENLQDLVEHALQRAGAPILLAMDEVDILQVSDFSRDFFSLLRSWHNLRSLEPLWRNLTLMMAISTEPYLLIDSIGESPFNVGLVVYLGDFTAEQVADLNRRYDSPLAAAALADMVRLLNGHPYLTRVALYTLVARHMAWHELERVAAADDGPFGQHLRRQLQLVLSDPRLSATLIEVLNGRPVSDQTVAYHLIKAGLIAGDSRTPVFRCELYRRYFADHLHG